MWAELLAPTVPELSKQAVEWQVSFHSTRQRSIGACFLPQQH